jgi:hypothetical protein
MGKKITFEMCSCELAGLTRPKGPIQIEKTRVVTPDVMVAKLSGAVKAHVGVVREGEDFYFVAPKGLGGTRMVPADSMTDCLHASVRELQKKYAKRKSSSKKK